MPKAADEKSIELLRGLLRELPTSLLRELPKIARGELSTRDTRLDGMPDDGWLCVNALKRSTVLLRDARRVTHPARSRHGRYNAEIVGELIVDYLYRHPKSPARDIVRAVDIPQAQFNTARQRLRNAKRIEREGEYHESVYRLTAREANRVKQRYARLRKAKPREAPRSAKASRAS